MKVNKIGEALGIEEYMGEDGYTYYVIDEKGKRTIRFDNIYSKWMRALYSLLCHIAIEVSVKPDASPKIYAPLNCDACCNNQPAKFLTTA